MQVILYKGDEVTAYVNPKKIVVGDSLTIDGEVVLENLTADAKSRLVKAIEYDRPINFNIK